MDGMSIREMVMDLFAIGGNPLFWLLIIAGLVVLVRLKCQRDKRLKQQSGMLATGLRDMGEMAVEEVRCTLAHCTKEPRRFFGKELPLVRERCIFTVDVVVRIGFDFEAVEARVDNVRRRIVLRLPAMRVLSTAVDYESMAVLDEKTGLFARPRLEAHREAMQHLTQEAEDKARVYGAFERAQSSAKTRLEAFVGKLYDLTVFDLTILQADGTQWSGNAEEQRIGA